MAPDGDQLSRARPGNDAEFIALIARHRDRFLRYATHMLGSREDAEETVQDTFVRIHRGLARADPERVDAWAFRILVNRVRSTAGRRRWWRRIAARLERAETIPAPEHEDGAWQGEIDRALEVLPAEQREAFLMKHVEDMSYQEIAEATGASVPALKMRVSRACDRLRAVLAEVPR